MKYLELVKTLTEYGALEPVSEAQIILCELFGVSIGQLLIDKDRDFNSLELENLLARRKEHEPLQYILGKWEFYGREFFVSPACLIPRPDTELLVEKALKILKKGEDVADFCTGSGCIGITLSLEKDTEVDLVDISADALHMAMKNANHHGAKCNFINSDIRQLSKDKKYDLITANPPYIPTRDIDTLSCEVKREPALALDGGADGLDIIDFLITDGLSFLKDGGVMLIEFGYDQGKKLDTSLGKIQKEGKISSYKIYKDYGGNDRLVLIIK
ncbi:MAG: peptide chain release factor N(5)-glutamine methyltransferase [Clostridia bacterium]|nr:peptide chain release factor N(5)-glutamine methyltransferase [Clostridia bacterium]